MAWVDGMSMPIGAENIDQVYAFIEHCYDAEAAGKAIDTHGYNSPVIGAEQVRQRTVCQELRRRLSGRRAAEAQSLAGRAALVRRRPRAVRGQVPERADRRRRRPRVRSGPGCPLPAPGPSAAGSGTDDARRSSASSWTDVSVQFGDFVAVRDASVRIEPGEFFSFLGPSGCGKTTILRTVSGFLEPSAGAVRIGGKDMAGIGPNRRPTALIFQNLALFPLMTVCGEHHLRARGARRAGAPSGASAPTSCSS